MGNMASSASGAVYSIQNAEQVSLLPWLTTEWSHFLKKEIQKTQAAESIETRRQAPTKY